MLAVDPAGGRPAHRRRRQHRHRRSSTWCSARSAVRRPRRRTLQLPAALGALACARTPPPSSTSPPTTWTGTARWRPTPPTRAASTRATRSPASTTPPTRPPRTWSGRPTSRRAAGPIGFTLGAPGPSQLGVVDGILVDRAFVDEPAAAAPRSWPRSRDVDPPRPAQHRQRARRRGPGPRLRGAAGGRTGRAARLPPGRRTASQHVADVGGRRATWTTPRPPTPMPPRPRWPRTSSIVWIAGGLAKGATFDELVADVGRRGCAAWC